jgi:hypothetical protein
MKIKLIYCDTLVGELEKTEDDKYIYTSNIYNEQKLSKERRCFKYSDYTLWNSFKKESSELFIDFETILLRCSREDVLKCVGITPEGSKWERLLKLSTLEVRENNFFVQLDFPDKGINNS